MIKFRCNNCGSKLSVPQIHAGKKGKCPKCKNVVVVPELEGTGSVPERSASRDSGIDSRYSDYDLSLLDVSQNQQAEQHIMPERDAEQAREHEEPESVGKRRLPWLLDIFLYPISMPGLTILGIIIIIPLLINLTAGLLGPFGILIWVPGIFINVVIDLYFLWYVAECIRDSAEGGIRAPEIMANAPGLGDMFWQWLYLLLCLFFLLGPLGYYYIKTHRIDVVFWFLLAYTILFLPMGLLAVVMFDSLRGLNPIFIIGSVFSTFFQYCGLVLILGVFVLAVIAVRNMELGRLLAFILGYIRIYILLVIAHLLGHFYWKCKDKLNWEV